MTKRENIDNPDSCWNKAKDDDIVFILKDTDETMAATIRFWMGERLRMGLNILTDSKIIQANKEQLDVTRKRRYAKPRSVTYYLD